MNYCMHCGAKLRMKDCGEEGSVPWCDRCGEYRFPVFSTAVSMIVMDEARENVLLIQQYGRPHYILVAGYVNKGEDAENAVRREVSEELGLTVKEMSFNRSSYFAPTNTLMLNFTVTVANAAPHPNREVDAWRWFSAAAARENVKPDSLAAAFLNEYLDHAGK